ncbi:hypothetical protein NMY22_g612 [Coprinellus aureogranulatus]|nr:hypothetical protein NMY22_g612 [Coprinellus aureogranulatus]
MALPLGPLDVRPQHMKQILEYYRHLPDEFLPMEVIEPPDDVPREKWDREAWRQYLCTLFPRSHIPTKLTLKSGVSLQPPRFLFGWAMELSVLRTIAESRGFAEHLRPLNFRKLAENLTSVVRSQCPQVVEQFGWSLVTLVNVHSKGMIYCLALADSWMTGNRKPSDEQISALRGFFGIGKGDVVALADNEAMWWTGLEFSHWIYRHKWEHLRDCRPWDLARRVAN